MSVLEQLAKGAAIGLGIDLMISGASLLLWALATSPLGARLTNIYTTLTAPAVRLLERTWDEILDLTERTKDAIAHRFTRTRNRRAGTTITAAAPSPAFAHVDLSVRHPDGTVPVTINGRQIGAATPIENGSKGLSVSIHITDPNILKGLTGKGITAMSIEPPHHVESDKDPRPRENRVTD